MITKQKKERFYFIGIAGTGMAATAGLLKEAGYHVQGSDQAIYPPMSTMLATYQIPVASPYSEQNLENINPDYVVVSNALSKDHPEIKKALALGLTLVSYPQVLGEFFLKKMTSIVVTGTHGKTTTTSLITHLCTDLGLKPSFMIGGVPKAHDKSFGYTGQEFFVIEGDEYDTAFFDKESKFLHYCPDYLILNNLEFDHADIFANLDAIKAMFCKLLKLVATPRKIIANFSDENVVSLLKELNIAEKVTKVYTKPAHLPDAFSLQETHFSQGVWTHSIHIPTLGNQTFQTKLAGSFNGANIAMAIALFFVIKEQNQLTSLDLDLLQKSIASFEGVKKRMDYLGSRNGVEVFEDFAHHPTAVKSVLENFRTSHISQRIIAAFEPKNASSRRNVFSDDFAKALSLADTILIAPCAVDMRIPTELRMNTSDLSQKIGTKALAFDSHQDLLVWLNKHTANGDAILFMSSGDFAGLPRQFLSQEKQPLKNI